MPHKITLNYHLVWICTRLRALISELGVEERALVDFLMEELERFTGEGWEQEDDITFLTLKRCASFS
jgi:hypothetical protein